jgi:hypothetical protein
MTKEQFSQYTPSKNGNRSIEEAISELQREMDTRKRIFDNWVAGGRCSWVDAHDRMERHLSALKLLIRYSNELDQATREDLSNTSSPSISFPESELDGAASAAA